LTAWDAEQQPMLFVHAISACSMAYMPEAVGVALFLVMWNYHKWRRLDSLSIGRDEAREEATERRLREQLASFQEFMKLMADGDQLARVGLGFNTMVRLTGCQQDESEMSQTCDDATTLEKAAMKWQAELDRMWAAAIAQSELNDAAAISTGTTLSSAM
jgi:hypothetical protein